MDLSLERDSSALGSLFQQIINDMKTTSPLWEDFVAKASKLHACLRAAIQAITAYLDAFQKIADAATNSRGASKEIGTALTRVCMRHKAVETRLKTFTTAIMDCLVQPLQDKLEDWKRTVATIDKDHAKEYKRCRTELKKRSNDTLRLQKKARKGQSDTIQSLMDSHMQDVTLRRVELEEVEKKSLRSAMVEERMRYCTFVDMLQPVVKEECAVMSELEHLQEAMQSISNVTKEPDVLPQASEELIHDAKATMTLYPESPVGGSSSQGGGSNSLGSRKSSVCSISSINSSGSSNSPGHNHYPRSLSQLISPAIRLKPGESSDSGFCSSPALTTQASTATSQSHAVSTWPPHSQDVVPLPPTADRPHTISTAYEKGHQRPPLTVYTFQNPETILEGSSSSGSNGGAGGGGGGGGVGGSVSGQNTPSTQKSPAGALSRPPLPVRCSSLERPLSANNNRNGNNLMQRQCPSPIPAHITKELSAHHAHAQLQQQQLHQQQQQQPSPHQQIQSPPTYVNMSELASMAALKITNQQQQQQQQQQQSQHQPMLQQQRSIDSISSQHSTDSLVSNTQQQQPNNSASTPNTTNTNTPRSHSISSSTSSNAPSLHSHPSIESGTAATSLIGQTPPTTSSGSSTPQNHYSPLLTNSPSSTAAGTPSGTSITSGGMSCAGGAGGSGFIYNISSPTPPQSASTPISHTSDILKITELDGCTGGMLSNNENISAPTAASNTGSSEFSNKNETNSNSTTVIDTDSPTIVENDERSRASVLQKASMFEKQAAAVAAAAAAGTTSSTNNTPPPPSSIFVRTSANVDAGIYGTRRSEDIYHSANQPQQQHQQQQVEQPDVDKSFEDSIQELNNLIGELDSFQREIDAGKQQQQQRTNTSIDPFPINGNACDYIETTTTTKIISSSNCDALDKAKAAVATAITTTIICQQQQQSEPQQYCTSNSYQTISDISDTVSDEIAADTRSLTSLNYHNNNESSSNCSNNIKQNCNYNSDSELSRFYVSDTSSLNGGAGVGDPLGDGYENPTFAHFAASSSASSLVGGTADDSLIGDSCSLHTSVAADSISHVSETLSMSQQYGYIDNGSDSGSAVVVIYDHQIPMTPDIDYVKQNSEIVVLRTKDPQQQQLQHQQEMREFKQLPTNLGGGESLTSSGSSTAQQHTATVAPAKQRLSSFRASSEQQLQLIGAGGQQQHRHEKGTQQKIQQSPDTRNSLKTLSKVENVAAAVALTATKTMVTATVQQQQHNDTILRRKQLPPKPSFSVFNGNTTSAENMKNGNMLSNKNQQQKMEPQVVTAKTDFKADLDAKIRKQRLKLLQQEQQLQKQTQQQPQSSTTTTTTTPTTPTTNNNSNNCNSNNNSIRSSSSTLPTTTASSSSYTSTPSSFRTQSPPQSRYQNGCNNNSSNSLALHSSTTSMPSPSVLLLNQSHSHSSPLPLSSTTNTEASTPSSSISSSCVPSSPAVVPVSVTNSPHQHHQSSSVSPSHACCSSTSAACTVSATTASTVSTSKPNITPRPASLSGGTTRIARRSSVNTAKPPPPVRRSSSVTPSHNATTGLQQQQGHQATHPSATNNLLHQQQNSMNISTESLPPPPAYLLDASSLTSRQASQSAPASVLPPVIPNSSLKVAETVKALSAIRHQPASPNVLRHQQQQTLQTQQQQPMLQSANLYSTTTTTAIATNSADAAAMTLMHDESAADYDAAYYNPYIEVNSYLGATSSSTSINALSSAAPQIVITNNSKLSLIYQKQQQAQQHHHHQPQQRQQQPLNYNNALSTNPLFLSIPSSSSSTPTPTQYKYHHDDALNHAAPPLPPPNPKHSQRINHNQQHHHQLNYQQYSDQSEYQQHQQLPEHYHPHHQHQQLHPELSSVGCDDAAIYGNNASFRTSSPGIYAQPKVVANMSSFRSASPGSKNGHHVYQPQAQQPAPHQQMPPAQPKTNPNLIAQLNARLNKQHQQNSAESIYGSTPNSPNHQQQQLHHQQQHNHPSHQQQQNEAIYLRNYGQQQQQMATQQSQPASHLQQHYDDYVSTNIEKTGNIRAKTKAEFLENLNAKLAKQGISGRAFAVRNLINSKALPDPRICHESLMDQIKRGATLKRNKKINDRSAPKIL